MRPSSRPVLLPPPVLAASTWSPFFDNGLGPKKFAQTQRTQQEGHFVDLETDPDYNSQSFQGMRAGPPWPPAWDFFRPMPLEAISSRSGIMPVSGPCIDS